MATYIARLRHRCCDSCDALRVLLIVIALALVITVWAMQTSRETEKVDLSKNDNFETDFPKMQRPEPELVVAANKTPIILFWNYVYPEKTPRALPETFTSDYLKCSVHDLLPRQKCYFTHMKGDIDRADIISLQYRRWERDFVPGTFKRSNKQIWVFHIWESPVHTYDWNWKVSLRANKQLLEMKGFFNWTMTYRLDSNVPYLYGRLVRRAKPDFARRFDRLANKSRNAVWMSSNCDTIWHRENYAAQLNKAGLDVEIIGRCNITKSILYKAPNSICERTDFYSTKSECMQQIGRTYKFYLAFENSLCVDYVTEKFYRAASLDLIPVVMNGADMSRFAPPHSYIDAKDFSSPTELADFLKKVGSDPKLYNSYFDWKPFYDVDVRWEGLAYTKNICKLCAAAHNQLVNPTTSVYADIEKWWVQQGNCVRKVY